MGEAFGGASALVDDGPRRRRYRFNRFGANDCAGPADARGVSSGRVVITGPILRQKCGCGSGRKASMVKEPSTSARRVAREADASLPSGFEKRGQARRVWGAEITQDRYLYPQLETIRATLAGDV